MTRPARFAGFVPVGFLACAAAIAVATLVGGWTVSGSQSFTGYGISAEAVAPHYVDVPTGYGIDEVDVR
jgi:hypothetical protein